ncbi:MAG: hypothetical protein ACJA1B_000589 [Polaribacter sp.]|jgi:hypothetical protein
MAGIGLNINVCGTFILLGSLREKYPAFCHYSYNLPLAFIKNDILKIIKMKIFIKILVLISLILTSCSKENEEYYSYNFSENKKLSIETYDESYMKYGNIEEGSNLVFEYEYSAEDEVNVSDDEYSEFIRF